MFTNIPLNYFKPHPFIQRILCTTDLSEESNQAVTYAIALAQHYSAKLFIFHCIKKTKSTNWHNHINVFFYLKELFDASIKELSKISPIFFEWEGIVVEGNIVEAVTQEARERNIDLIVMHSTRKPFLATIFGSTIETICQFAPCPVLVTRSKHCSITNTTSYSLDIKRILVAYNFEKNSKLALSLALSFAQEHLLEVDLLYVLPTIGHLAISDEANQQMQKAQIQRIKADIPKDTFCNVEVSVTEGNIYKQILEYVENKQIDLIFMGATENSASKKNKFNSNINWVLRFSYVPIFIVCPIKT